MIKNKREITDELKKMIANSDNIAQMIYDAITKSKKTNEVKNSLISLHSQMPSLVVERGHSEQMKKWLNDPAIDKPSLYKAIEREATEVVLIYDSLIADYLSSYRSDKKCMGIVKETYLSYEATDYEHYRNAQENLGSLCVDENCLLYNLGEAFVYFSLARAKDSDNPEVLYGYAKSLNACDNVFMRMDAFPTFKKAADLGHEKAKEEFAKLCRLKKLCTNCGGQFKGFFIKKCSGCGKKKNY